MSGVSGSSLPSTRGRLSRKKVFARDLVSTISSKTEKLSGSVGGMGFHVQRTTVNVQRALKYMPETRSRSKNAEIIDLVDDEDGAGPSRRYRCFLHLLYVILNFLFSARLVLFLLLPALLLLSVMRDFLPLTLLKSLHWMGSSLMTL